MRSSRLSRFISGLGRARGPLVTGLVYTFAPRVFTRIFYREQGKAAGSCYADKGGVVNLSFDVDHPEDVEALGPLCELLDRLGLKASFAVIGKWVEKYPREHLLAVEAGHEILNHTYTHPDHEILHPDEPFDSLGPGEQQEEIKRCHRACVELLGVSPLGFRAPHFGNVQGRGFYSALSGAGYRFSSSVTSVDSP
ncbi:MAG: polysaccharide deacetylase family protein, partial [Candidatus Glassbacteria bacterium]|nr:polysaccharide deacetylase family protein [Candidatus Glassbacteria bacterium]